MIDTLYTNGCSWTAGNELEFDPIVQQLLADKKLRIDSNRKWILIDEDNKHVGHVTDFWPMFNWPKKLSERLSVTRLIDQSLGGSSNSRLLRTTCEFVKQYPAECRENLLMIIGWTISDRSELYLDNRHGYADWVQFNSNVTFSKSIRDEFRKDKDFAASIDQFQKDYILSIDNEHAQLAQYFQHIYLLSNLLNNLKIKYMFFNALPAWWDAGIGKYKMDVDTVFNKEISWQDKHPYIMQHQDSMHCYVLRNKFPRAPDKHPLVLAHDSWANYLHTALKTRGIVR